MSANITVDFSGLPNLMNDVYVPILHNTSRYLVLYGGAGSGKSVSVAQKLVMRMVSEVGHKILVVRKVEATIRESARAELIGAIEEMGLKGLFKYSTSESGSMTISCINGNKFVFKGLDNKEKLKSIKDITAVWLEEASDFTLDDFTQLDLRLRGKHIKNYKQIILSFNPISAKHWLKKRFFDEKDEDATVMHTTYLDNKFLDDNYIKILTSLKKTNFAYYQIYALGKWGVLKGLIYTDYTIVDELPKDADIHRYGVDFGFNHPTACTEVKIIHKEGIEQDELYLDEIVYESMLTNTQLMRKIKTVAPHLLDLKGYLDSAEPARIADFELAGFDVVGALKDVTAGIDKCQSMKIFVTKRSTHIIDELDLYCWKLDRNGNPLDEVLKENDDACDSFRYATFIDNEENKIVEIIKTPSLLSR
jgi:phage terminase large subunit